jgi:hypothetical protein
LAGWIKGAVAVAGVFAGGAAGAAALGNRKWSRTTSRAVEGLTRRTHTRSGSFSPALLEGLPDPVARYFETALEPGQPFVRSARVEHSGEFRTGGLDDPWTDFHSVQHFTADPPGFVWDARIRMGRLLGVRVRDCYVGGRGSMIGRLAGLFPVVDQQGTPELAAGALIRWLAEAAWFPTALLPRPGLAWEAIDDSSARATLSDSGIGVSIDCRFGAAGEIVQVNAQRYRNVHGVGILTPWTVDLRDHALVAGMRIPLQGEVAWLLPEGRLSYWRGRIEKIEHSFNRPTTAGVASSRRRSHP